MDGTLRRLFEDFIGRLDGPMHLRMFFQPLMACIFAIVDGRRDAQKGRAPYFWALFSEPEHRKAILRRSWRSVGKIFILALVLDVVYQLRTLTTFYPGEAILTALLLAVVPYLMLRGPVNRLIPRKWIGQKS